jgi:hypothetical protein
MSLATVDHIWELDWISNEEEGCVVAHEIADSLFSVKLYSKAAGVSVSIREPFLSEGG